LFVQQKIILHIDIDDRHARFDGEISPHAHFRCKKCGCIVDIPLPEVKDLFPKEQGYAVDEAYINLKGVCKNCEIA